MENKKAFGHALAIFTIFIWGGCLKIKEMLWKYQSKTVV